MDHRLGTMGEDSFGAERALLPGICLVPPWLCCRQRARKECWRRVAWWKLAVRISVKLVGNERMILKKECEPAP